MAQFNLSGFLAPFNDPDMVNAASDNDDGYVSSDEDFKALYLAYIPTCLVPLMRVPTTTEESR